MSIILNKKYEILESIGEGTFGRVFKGKNTQTLEIVAIKVQYKNTINVLKYEAKIYKHLRDISGIPQLRNYGAAEGFTYLIIDYMDLSLSEKNFTQREILT